MNMEVDSPTQHSPIHVDIQSFYRVTFDNMKYLPVKKQWEITVKLEDLSEGKVIGETEITWPHSDPPHTIIYDSERKLLHWENNQSNAYLPIRLPARPTYDLKANHGPRVNPKLLVRPSLSDSGNQSPVKISRESPWKELMKTQAFLNKDKSAYLAIESDFNPLFEERLPVDEQKRALTAIAENYQRDGVKDLLQRLLKMRFFELGALNTFIAEYHSSSSSPPTASATPNGHLTNGHNHSEQNGHATSTTVAPEQEDAFLYDLVAHPQVVLCDVSYVALLRCCALLKSRRLRRLLISKNMPLDESLRCRVMSELESGVVFFLLRHFTQEFFTSGNTSSEVLGKVLDLLLFLTNGIDERVIWADDNYKHMRTVKETGLMLKSMTTASLKMGKVLSVKKLNSDIGELPPPASDYKRRRVVFYKKFVQ